MTAMTILTALFWKEVKRFVNGWKKQVVFMTFESDF